MLALVEDHLQGIRDARSDRDIFSVLSNMAKIFGYRSGFIIEYAGPSKVAAHVVDTNEQRSKSWEDYFEGPMHDSENVAALLAKGPVIFIDESRFTAANQSTRDFCQIQDTVDCTIVPILHRGEIVGIVGFSGSGHLDHPTQAALQIISYNLFAQMRLLGNIPIKAAPPSRLTSREKEVMQLAAEGLTSHEISGRLGMSPRTVNQHVDNVAHKLNTKNRTHTVAEAIRHDLLE